MVDQDNGRWVVMIPPTRGLQLATASLCVLVLSLPLLMGQRTPETLTLSQLVLIGLTSLSLFLAWASRELKPPTRVWWGLGLAMTGVVALQVAPIEWLARAFGPYPDLMWSDDTPGPRPLTWSPDIGATLRSWSVFMALLGIAWLVSHLPRPLRMWLWIAIVLSAGFQAFYGLISHAGGSTTVLGIWERNNVNFVHGSFSNRNVFAGYLALIWPLAVGIWFIRRVPALGRLPDELKLAGALFSGGLLGAALLGSASRLGSAAGILGIVFTIVLWQRHRRAQQNKAAWPAWIAAAAAVGAVESS